MLVSTNNVLVCRFQRSVPVLFLFPVLVTGCLITLSISTSKVCVYLVVNTFRILLDHPIIGHLGFLSDAELESLPSHRICVG